MSVAYRAVGDFSVLNGNPNGVWTYGSTAGMLTAFGFDTDVEYWQSGSASTFVVLDTSAVPVIGFAEPTVVLPTGVLGLISTDQTFVEVEFTAPTNGTYVVAGSFVGIDTSQVSHDVSVTLESRDLLVSTISSEGQDTLFSFLLTLHQGDKVSFVNHTDGLANTAIGLSATVSVAEKYAWRTGASGDWDTAANWRHAAVPGELDIANINMAGTYTVTTTVDRNLAELLVGKAGATLEVADSTFSAMATTNRGTITVGDRLANATLNLEGNIENDGSIALIGGSGGRATLLVGAGDGTVRLTGTGSIALGGTNANGYVIGAFPDSKLINAGNTIVGAGTLGGNSMDIVNRQDGIISATVAGEALVIDTSDFVLTNLGELSAQNGAILSLTGAVDCAGVSAEIRAEGAGSVVVLDNADVNGTFALHADPDAAVTVAGGVSSLLGEATLTGAVNVDAVANLENSALVLGGSITNTGTISLIGETYDPLDPDPIVAELGIVDRVTLQGGGSVVISGGGPDNGIFDFSPSHNRLVNLDNTIEGAGAIDISLDNRAGGLVDANVNGELLGILSGSTRNAGTLQASNGGFLAISGGLLSDAGSVIKATGAGSQVVFGGVLLDGTAHLVSEDGGSFAMVGPNIAFNGLTLDGNLSLDASLFDDFALLIFERRLTNTGSIIIAGLDEDCGCGPLSGELAVGRGGSLAGGGTITLVGGPDLAQIRSEVGPARLINIDNTIEGAGSIGGDLILTNHAAGLIEANVAGQSLELGGGAAPIVNKGTLKASNGGTLRVLSDVTRDGAAIIEGGAIEFQAGSRSAVSFTSGSGMLELDDSDVFRGTVAGLADSEHYTVNLADIDFGSIVSASYKSNAFDTKGHLTISDGVDTAIIRLVGAFSDDVTVVPPSVGFTGFVLADNGSSGTTVNYVSA